MRLNRMYVVISACTGTNDDDANTKALESYLNSSSLNYDAATGCYEGCIEQSFIVQIPEFYCIGGLLKQAKKYRQESIMLVDANDNAFLLYVDTNVIKSLGVLFHTQDAERVTQLDNYTLSNGTVYYTL